MKPRPDTWCKCKLCLADEAYYDKQLWTIHDNNTAGRIEVGDTWELDDRTELVARLKPSYIAAGLQAFAAFMGGLAHVLYVRAELRFSKGHAPIGKNPASGEMWNKEEIAEAMVSVNRQLYYMLKAPLYV